MLEHWLEVLELAVVERVDTDGILGVGVRDGSEANGPKTYNRLPFRFPIVLL